ncbi:uncharacterized protein L969DRAFT_103156 [Mixia osmundae IAM 14324]|uniref:F-box domain-containing protein n=1 Tax=Mixia osmundae (strain CBS 9802 / IAM 14324 / JCM 22182 / KY 12970) TaxID=764103 RepID=G7E8F0_MIXOS|nr:uncharacterized protein L969DRAFT_103156 [Mixia osmundae IAM 14324]KEI39212.1 hypothetical protein L969DRAFT_103156 [Mixia osmundae IAM 14324]GAA99110.1 hypothetical protein E5Q_05799 [Mixia osmundae IAM 14324]
MSACPLLTLHWLQRFDQSAYARSQPSPCTASSRPDSTISGSSAIRLPVEIAEEIIEHLVYGDEAPSKQLATLALVCREWRVIVQERYLFGRPVLLSDNALVRYNAALDTFSHKVADMLIDLTYTNRFILSYARPQPGSYCTLVLNQILCRAHNLRRLRLRGREGGTWTKGSCAILASACPLIDELELDTVIESTDASLSATLELFGSAALRLLKHLTIRSAAALHVEPVPLCTRLPVPKGLYNLQSIVLTNLFVLADDIGYLVSCFADSPVSRIEIRDVSWAPTTLPPSWPLRSACLTTICPMLRDDVLLPFSELEDVTLSAMTIPLIYHCHPQANIKRITFDFNPLRSLTVSTVELALSTTPSKAARPPKLEYLHHEKLSVRNPINDC